VRGHIRKRGSSWTYVIDRGERPCQRCDSCARNYWIGAKRLGACPQCSGLLRETRARRRAWKGGFDTKREASEALTEVLTALKHGTHVEPSKQTTGEWLEEWLLGSDLSPTTRDNYSTMLAVYICPRIGDVSLQELTGTALNHLPHRLRWAGR
jgi:hypothetical protein